jgi:sulfite oxidase
VQSAICVPADGAAVDKSDELLTLKGYAFSGAGKDIDNVKVSIDGGATWECAVLKKVDQPYNRYFRFSLQLQSWIFT